MFGLCLGSIRRGLGRIEYVMTYGTYMYVIVTLTCPTCPTDAMHPRGYKGDYGDYIYKWGDVQVKGRHLTLLLIMHYFYQKLYENYFCVLKRCHRFDIQSLFPLNIVIMVHLLSLLIYSVQYSY